jgi:glycosyltransferase involved in cell wall biosynthesis
VRAYRPLIRSELRIGRAEDDFIVYDPVTDQTALLNLSAAAVLDLCDGRKTVEEIVVALARATSVQPHEIVEDIEDTILDLAAKHLLHPSDELTVLGLPHDNGAAVAEVGKTNSIGKVSFPFVYIVGAARRDLGCVAMLGPLRSAADAEMFHRLKAANYSFVGVTSFKSFPANTELGDLTPYPYLCEAWCHCFRDPDLFIPPRMPKLLLSMSDFQDPNWITPARFRNRATDSSIAYDFIYVCAPDSWSEQVKNLALAKRCFPVLCDEMQLKGLLVGRGATDENPYPRGLTMLPYLPLEQFFAYLARARFVFVPHELDASPRMICDALCLNVPVVCNRNILGGWKYINEGTGCFFENEEDITGAARYVLEHLTGTETPRQWYAQHYGPEHAGRRLAGFLQRLALVPADVQVAGFSDRADRMLR